MPAGTAGVSADRAMQANVADVTSVIVVSYQSVTTLERCLRAVLDSSVPVEICVVDNASDDGSAEFARRWATSEARVRFIGNPENRGFATACNQGAALSTGSALLFLNPDAFIDADSIQRLRRHLANDRTIGLIGCRVVDGDGKVEGPQRRREPTWRRSLMTMTGFSRLERRWPAFEGIEQPPEVAGSGLQKVDAVNGAVMLLPRDVFDRIGGFDEGFRLHAEDLDLCRRVRDSGASVMYAGDVEVMHIGGVSGRRRPFWVEWQKTRSLWRYFRKHEYAASTALATVVALGLAARFAIRSAARAIQLFRRSD